MESIKKPKKYSKPIFPNGWHSVDDPPHLNPDCWRHERPFLVTCIDGKVYTAFYARIAYNNQNVLCVKSSGEPRWWVSQKYSDNDEKIIDIVAWTEFPEPY